MDETGGFLENGAVKAVVECFRNLTASDAEMIVQIFEYAMLGAQMLQNDIYLVTKNEVIWLDVIGSAVSALAAISIARNQ